MRWLTLFRTVASCLRSSARVFHMASRASWFLTWLVATTLVLTSCALFEQNPSPQKVLRDAIRATSDVSSVRIKRVFSDGLEASYVEEWQLPGRLHTTGESEGIATESYHIGDALYRRSVGSDGEWSAWEEIAAPLDRYPFGFLDDFREVSLRDTESFDGRLCDVIVLTDPKQTAGPMSLHEDQYVVWIDAETSYPVKALVDGYWTRPATQIATFYDYDASIRVDSPQ